MQNGRMATALMAAAETERAVKFYIDCGGDDSPLELARAWEVYRGAVSLRKALDRWVELRRWREANAAQQNAATA
jgi:hypothetical protein